MRESHGSFLFKIFIIWKIGGNRLKKFLFYWISCFCYHGIHNFFCLNNSTSLLLLLLQMLNKLKEKFFRSGCIRTSKLFCWFQTGMIALNWAMDRVRRLYEFLYVLQQIFIFGFNCFFTSEKYMKFFGNHVRHTRNYSA